MSLPPDLIDLSTAPVGGAILLILLAPLLEEHLFRGLILRGLLSRQHPVVAVVLSALAFGVAHANIRQGFLAGILGLALGWWYARTRSVGPGMVGHCRIQRDRVGRRTGNASAIGISRFAQRAGRHRAFAVVVHFGRAGVCRDRGAEFSSQRPRHRNRPLPAPAGDGRTAPVVRAAAPWAALSLQPITPGLPTGRPHQPRNARPKPDATRRSPRPQCAPGPAPSGPGRNADCAALAACS